MKKTILLVAVALIGFNANAQSVDFGVKAGVNFASVSGDDTDDLNSRTGFHFGVIAGIPVSDNFSVQPELVYSQQGTEYSASEGYDGKYKLDYLNIPIMAQFQVADGLHLEAGPQFGFLLSANEEYNSPGDSGEEDVSDFIKGTDISVGVGASYTMASGLGIGARYNLGVSEIFEENSGKNQNSVIQISVSYLFGKGKSND